MRSNSACAPDSSATVNRFIGAFLLTVDAIQHQDTQKRTKMHGAGGCTQFSGIGTLLAMARGGPDCRVNMIGRGAGSVEDVGFPKADDSPSCLAQLIINPTVSLDVP